MGIMPKRAVFMDRDGTVSEEIGYVNHVSRFRLLPRSAAAIARLNAAGVPAVVTTNQAGAARGYFPEKVIHEVHEKMRLLLADGGARLDGIYFCAHHPTVGEPPYRMDCDCRKPRTGLLVRAARDLDLDVAGSYVVGDRFSDIELARNANCKGILVLTGYGRGEWKYKRAGAGVEPDFVAGDLLDAVEWILEDIKLG
jgi:D-glycero-D-manno-heptose 1,7-bisphosphate phosphatase